MALNIKNDAVEALAAEVARLTGETKTEAIRLALHERKARLGCQRWEHRRLEHLLDFLEREIWPHLAKDQPISKRQREEILGYGEDGV